MRQIINISLPAPMVRDIKKEIKDGDFASTSEFFRHILRERKLRRLARELQEDEKKFAAGQGKKINSLSDLS